MIKWEVPTDKLHVYYLTVFFKVSNRQLIWFRNLLEDNWKPFELITTSVKPIAFIAFWIISFDSTGTDCRFFSIKSAWINVNLIKVYVGYYKVQKLFTIIDLLLPSNSKLVLQNDRSRIHVYETIAIN